MSKFEKGKSGNPGGRPKGKGLPDLNKLMIKIMAEEKDKVTAAEAILKVLRAQAAKGNIRAAEILLDRAYGKAKETHAVTIDDERKRVQELFRPLDEQGETD